MALVLNDRVKETTTTTGTGAVALDGAVSKFETFAAGIGNSNTTYYAIVHRTAVEFEVGLGTLDGDSSDLTRTTVISSSNSDNAVDFSAGTKDVFCTIPASKLVFEDASSNVTLPNDLVLGSDSSVLKFGADSDTTLTHTDGTGLTLNSTNKLLFRDTGLYINSSTDGQLDIVADSEIQIAATTIDINGAVALNGAITGATNITLTGELDAATLDISGNADIDGTLEADAITINGVTLAETISDTVGAMVTSNTESGITVAYDDADNTLDFTVGTLNQDTTGSAATLTTARNIGGTSFNGSANIAVALASVGTAVTVADESSDTTCFPLFATAATGDLGPKSGSNLTFNSSSGLLTATLLAGDLTGDVTGNADTATLASTITATANNTTAETVYLTFVDGATGAQGIETDTGLTWNPNTNVLTAANVAGTVTTATQNSITTATGLVSTGALNSGSITSGFGTIDNGASNITSGGLLKLDVDADADDLTGDSATGRLTIGAGEDLNLYHGGTNSYIVNDTGDLIIDTAGDIKLDAAGNDFKFLASGTEVFNITNSSSDVIIKPVVDAKDLIFQQRDGTEVMRIEDGAYASFAAAAVNPEATLTDGATVSWNGLTSPVAKVTLGGNRTLAAASGVITGQFLSILFIQDGTGSRTITFNAAYEHTGDVAPVLTTTAAKGDLFVYRYNGAKFLEVGRNLNLTLS